MSSVDAERIAEELKEIRKMIAAMGARVVVAALTLDEAAQMLSCSPRHISRMVKRGILRPSDVGGMRRIPVSQIHRLLEQPEQPEQSEPQSSLGRPSFDPAAFSAKLKRLRRR